MLGPRRARGDETLYARAVPQKVELTETYAVEQEISQNRNSWLAGDGTGRIEVSVPYDGNQYFTRLAVADVERVLGPRGTADERRAAIGHLLLADHTKTEGLRAEMRPHGQAGVIPLVVPAATRDGGLDLTGDRQACRISYDYRPQPPELYPLELTVEIDDIDSMTAASFENASMVMASTLVTQGRTNPSFVIERLRQEAGFSNQLLLKFGIQISVPVKEHHPALWPIIRHLSVEWPTLTSLHSTQLYVADNLVGDKMHRAEVRYNPVKRRLEWRDVRTWPDPENPRPQEAGTRVFHGAVCGLLIGHPGELLKDDELKVRARVEIPNYLLSGMEARLYGADGRPPALQPRLTTKLDVGATVVPTDIFAKRSFAPYQQFVFDDIIPDEMRITDVVTVLRGLRFTPSRPDNEPPSDPHNPTWLVLAHRSQGPDRLDLLIVVEGTHKILGREQLMGGDVKLSGERESGQLKVSVLGMLPRDHRELTREMNVFQQRLRDRFASHQMSKKAADRA